VDDYTSTRWTIKFVNALGARSGGRLQRVAASRILRSEVQPQRRRLRQPVRTTLASFFRERSPWASTPGGRTLSMFVIVERNVDEKIVSMVSARLLTVRVGEECFFLSFELA
jgi:hypothetical protein